MVIFHMVVLEWREANIKKEIHNNSNDLMDILSNIPINKIE